LGYTDPSGYEEVAQTLDLNAQINVTSPDTGNAQLNATYTQAETPANDGGAPNDIKVLESLEVKAKLNVEVKDGIGTTSGQLAVDHTDNEGNVIAGSVAVDEAGTTVALAREGPDGDKQKLTVNQGGNATLAVEGALTEGTTAGLEGSTSGEIECFFSAEHNQAASESNNNTSTSSGVKIKVGTEGIKFELHMEFKF
jgi:hypothetical protein